MYSKKQHAKLVRLHRRLRKIGFRFYGIDCGFGPLAIVTSTYEAVPNSEVWLEDFIDGRITGRHISKALLQGSTPDEVAAEAEAKKEASRRVLALRRAGEHENK